MGKNKVAIVIPIYREIMDENERISFDRVIDVFKDREIFFLGPNNISYDNYLKNAININSSIKVIKVDPKFFGTIKRQNRLLLTKEFYQYFENYEFILYHHLDAFVFQDNLDYWCDLDYDFIGGPWLDCQLQYGNRVLMYSVSNVPKVVKLTIDRLRGVKEHLPGNGGFSLKKTSSILNALDKLKSIQSKWDHRNEDVFWSFVVPNNLSSFKVAPFKTALQFAFDMDPEKSLNLNNNQIPFGCHAWSKPENIGFWMPIIKEYIKN